MQLMQISELFGVFFFVSMLDHHARDDPGHLSMHTCDARSQGQEGRREFWAEAAHGMPSAIRHTQRRRHEGCKGFSQPPNALQ